MNIYILACNIRKILGILWKDFLNSLIKVASTVQILKSVVKTQQKIHLYLNYFHN
jgi:hypothetical protein